MKLYNINYDHVITHRVGWDNLINKVIENIDCDIGIVDFIE